MLNWTSKLVKDNLNASQLPKSRFSFFVYGSLRPGQEAFKRICLAYPVKHFPAWINGQLYLQQESYPILLDHEAGRVFGDVIFFDSEMLLEKLDQWEAYNPSDPDKGDYKRINTLAYLFNGQIINNISTYAANIHYSKETNAVPFSEWPQTH